MKRKSKLVSLAESVADIHDGAEVATGGWIFNSQPMALVRALAQRGVRNLRLIPAPGSIAPDLLIGAGCVATTACVFISFEQFGLAPQFRRAAESGAIKVLEMDGPGIAGGLRAGSCDLPYMIVPDLATDLPRVNPETYRPIKSQPGERAMLSVPSIQPEFVLLHVQQADEYGNAQYYGPSFFDALMAQAGKKVIISADRIVDSETIRKNVRLTKIPAGLVHAVVEAPFGAHPGTSAGLYDIDQAHLIEYVKASATVESFEAYLKRYVSVADNHLNYLQEIGKERLAGLSESLAASL